MDRRGGRARGRGRARGGGRARGRGRARPVDDFYEEVDDFQPVPAVVNLVDATRGATLVKEVMKLGAGPFLGGTDHLVADQWIMNLSGCFGMVMCTDLERTKIASFLLKGEAQVWWESVKRTVDVTAMNWGEFERRFRDKYFPSALLERLEMEFLALEQGTMEVREYEAEFFRLYRYVRPWDELSLARKFERGLKASLRRLVASWELPTAELVAKKAQTIELNAQVRQDESAAPSDSQGKRKAVMGSGDSGQRGEPWRKQRTFQQAPAMAADAPLRAVPVRQAPPLRCHNCGELGHFSRECRQQKVRVCYTCNQVGHIARDCPRAQPRGQADQQRQLPAGQARVYAIGQRDTGAAGN